MHGRLIPLALLTAYTAFLIKVMVLKDIPLVKVGHLMLNFGGAEAIGTPNFVPFSTIVPYLFGHKGLVIAGINLVGNVGLLVPFGALLPFVHRTLGWRKVFVVSLLVPVAIEVAQAVLRIGIFDIDDVILNAVGIVIGHLISTLLINKTEGRPMVLRAVAIVVAALMLVLMVWVFIPRNENIYPPHGNACFDQLMDTLETARANSSLQVPLFSPEGVRLARCSSTRGFVTFEIAGADTSGKDFHLYDKSGGMAASGADSLFDYCYTSDGKVVSQTRIAGREGAVSTSTCTYDPVAGARQEDRYEFTR